MDEQELIEIPFVEDAMSEADAAAAADDEAVATRDALAGALPGVVHGGQ
nr:hypothetical protein [Cupriavidus gilardii]WDE72648.1 hypothetical protein [Cupriavidus gilardii]